MFVSPHFQGRGVGRALAQAVIQAAKESGYASMLLDTSIRQVEAQRLYQSLGFRRIPPYYDVPQRIQDWLVFMELRL